MEGARFTQEQIEQAKNTSMTELARYMGYTPVRIGKYMALKEMDSIRIYDDKSWYRWSDKTGGTPVDFLLKFGNYTFREAVETLLNLQGVRTEFVGKEIQVMQSKQSERMEFHLPEPADNFKRMFAYLMKTRNLSYEVVSYFVKKKLLYEEKEHHNCVFVGRDPEGIPRHATCRGTSTGMRFVGDVEGNNKNYVLHVINPDSDEIKVFEAAIDCMSYMDLSGDYRSNKQVLGMTSDNPLEQTLKDHPHIRKISFCLDWDSAGRKAVHGDDNHMGLLKKYKEMGYLVRDISSIHEKYLGVPENFNGKDWNELLAYSREEKRVAAMNQEQEMPGRMEERSR